MMTTNKLTKTFASGSLAIGVLAGAVLTANSASAMTLTWAQWTGTSATLGTPLTDSGATATFVPVGGNYNPIGAEPVDTVTLFKAGDEYELTYSALPGASAINTSAGSFTYTITFPEPVTGVAMDSDVTASGYGNATKTLAEISLQPFLTSTDGSADPLSGFKPISPKQLLTVTDTLNPNTPGGQEGLSILSNNFTTKVPEPGTILGLLAVGGLGMVSRLKRQK